MSREIDREARNYCAETCPAVDKVRDDFASFLTKQLHEMVEEIKDVGTHRLRDALRSAVSDKQDAEAERDGLADEVADLKREIESLQSHIAELEKELEAEKS